FDAYKTGNGSWRTTDWFSTGGNKPYYTVNSVTRAAGGGINMNAAHTEYQLNLDGTYRTAHQGIGTLWNGETLVTDNATSRFYDPDGRVSSIRPTTGWRDGGAQFKYGVGDAINEARLESPHQPTVEFQQKAAGTFDVKISGKPFTWQGNINVVTPENGAIE